MSKLLETIREVDQHLQINKYYPVDAFVWEEGETVYEFPFIQKITEKDFIVHSQRHHALNPFQLAEKAEWSFDNLKEAYKKWHELEHGTF